MRSSSSSSDVSDDSARPYSRTCEGIASSRQHLPPQFQILLPALQSLSRPEQLHGQLAAHLQERGCVVLRLMTRGTSRPSKSKGVGSSKLSIHLSGRGACFALMVLGGTGVGGWMGCWLLGLGLVTLL
jgi:hypothetical protein